MSWRNERLVDLGGGLIGTWGGRSDEEPWAAPMDPFRLPHREWCDFPQETENVYNWMRERGGASFSRDDAAGAARRCGLLDHHHAAYGTRAGNHLPRMFDALEGLEYYDQIRTFYVKRKGTHLFIVNPGLLVPPVEPVGSMAFRRMFTHDQKRELWFAAGGRCSICRIRLGPDWHADHVIPWSKGGLTVIENGQALCQPCNSRKHAKVLTVDE